MPLNPEHNWFKIAESFSAIEFSANGLAEIHVHGKLICIARKGTHLFACTQKCPHAGGNLSEGFIDGSGNIVCPLHGYRFDPKTGRNVSGEGYHLKRFKIEQRDDGVFVYLAGGSIFGEDTTG